MIKRAEKAKCPECGERIGVDDQGRIRPHERMVLALTGGFRHVPCRGSGRPA